MEVSARVLLRGLSRIKSRLVLHGADVMSTVVFKCRSIDKVWLGPVNC